MKKKEVNYQDFVICKIKASVLDANYSDQLKLFIEKDYSALPQHVVGYVSGGKINDTQYAIGISIIKVEDFFYEQKYNDPINSKKSLNISLGKLHKAQSNIARLNRLKDNTYLMDNYSHVYFLDYPINETIEFVKRRMQRKYKLTDEQVKDIIINF